MESGCGDTAPEFTYPAGNIPGKALIICNRFIHYDGIGHSVQPDRGRPGAKEDVTKLSNVLSKLGFEVQVKFDRTSVEMITDLQTVASDDHSSSGCFLCIISTHGGFDYVRDDGVVKRLDYIEGNNGMAVHVDTLTRCVLTKEKHGKKRASTLENKPKIFLLQNCRGVGLPLNIVLTEEGGQVTGAKEEQYVGSEFDIYPGVDPVKKRDARLGYILPAKLDFFLHYATTAGFVSFKKGKEGTPFLQAWVDVLSNSADQREIHDLATLVNAKVCEEYASWAPSAADLGAHKRKQAPQFVSAMRKDFFLPYRPF